MSILTHGMSCSDLDRVLCSQRPSCQFNAWMPDEGGMPGDGEGAGASEVGPGQQCSPRHPLRYTPSLIELHGIVRYGEHS